MDQRRNPRYPIQLNALVHPSEGRSWLCTIQDFCIGGMLLIEQDSGRIRRSMPSLAGNETVGIHFSVPVSGKTEHFRLEGKIVRVLDNGVGINFANGMDDKAMTALLGHSTADYETGEPSAVVEREPSAAVDREPSAAPVKEPSAAVDKEPSADPEKEPPAARKKEPSAARKKEPSAPRKKKSAATRKKEPSARQDKEPSARPGKNLLSQGMKRPLPGEPRQKQPVRLQDQNQL